MYLHDQAINKHPDVPSLSQESIVEAVRLAIEVSFSAESQDDAVSVP